MKPFWLMLAGLVVLAAAFAGWVVVPRTRPPVDCRSRVVLGRDASGQSVECVCLEGRLSTCFEPGP